MGQSCSPTQTSVEFPFLKKPSFMGSRQPKLRYVALAATNSTKTVLYYELIVLKTIISRPFSSATGRAAGCEPRQRREDVRVPTSLYIQVYRSGSPGQILGVRG